MFDICSDSKGIVQAFDPSIHRLTAATSKTTPGITKNEVEDTSISKKLTAGSWGLGQTH